MSTKKIIESASNILETLTKCRVELDKYLEEYYKAISTSTPEELESMEVFPIKGQDIKKVVGLIEIIHWGYDEFVTASLEPDKEKREYWKDRKNLRTSNEIIQKVERGDS